MLTFGLFSFILNIQLSIGGMASSKKTHSSPLHNQVSYIILKTVIRFIIFRSPHNTYQSAMDIYLDSHGYNGEYSIHLSLLRFHGVPHLLLFLARALSLSLTLWLLGVPTLPIFDLRHVELDINDRIWRIGCDRDANVHILFFLLATVWTMKTYHKHFFFFPMMVLYWHL